MKTQALRCLAPDSRRLSANKDMKTGPTNLLARVGKTMLQSEASESDKLMAKKT